MNQLDLNLSRPPDSAGLAGSSHAPRRVSRGLMFITLIALCWGAVWLLVHLLF